MSITAAATGGHAIGWTAGAFSILASGTTAPASTKVFPLVVAHVHTCALKTSAHAPVTNTRGSSPVRAPTAASANRTAEMPGTLLCDMRVLRRDWKHCPGPGREQTKCGSELYSPCGQGARATAMS